MNQNIETSDNDYCITFEQTRKMLYDLFEVIGFQIVHLAADKTGKLRTEKYGDNFANAFWVDPIIMLNKSTKSKLDYRLLLPYGLGWPAHIQPAEFYLGAGNTTFTWYQGEHNFPTFVHGKYVKATWSQVYDKKVNKALLDAMFNNEKT